MYIHYGDIQRIFKRLPLRGDPSAATAKEEGLQRDVKLEGWVISREHSSKGRSFHADEPITENAYMHALRCVNGLSRYL